MVKSSPIVLMIATAMVVVGITAAPAASDTWRSALYPEDWTPDIAPDDAGRFIHDFSYAGYAMGEKPIPETRDRAGGARADHPPIGRGP